MVNLEKKFTSLLNAVYGNQVETSLSSCGHTCTDFAIRSRRKGKTEKFVQVR